MFFFGSASVSRGALLRAVRVVMVRYVLMAPPPPPQQQPLCLLSKITLGPNNYISQFIACHIYCVQDAERLSTECSVRTVSVILGAVL
jgi:hypothetical protein